MINAKIVGAGGYGGVGITELILRHPHVNIGCLVSLSDTGRLMSDVYPHLKENVISKSYRLIMILLIINMMW